MTTLAEVRDEMRTSPLMFSLLTFGKSLPPILDEFRDKRLFINRSDIDRLPEYSATDPTGVYVGKVWKRNIHPACRRRGGPAGMNQQQWVVCEYCEAPPKYKAIHGDVVLNHWYQDVVVLEDSSGPTQIRRDGDTWVFI